VMPTYVLIILLGLAYYLGVLRTKVKTDSTIERLTIQRNAYRERADRAECELEFERFTNPTKIMWNDRAEKVVDRILEQARAEAIAERIKKESAR